jgi:hypothetical protein
MEAPDDRRLMMVSSLVAQYRINELPFHLRFAPRNGLTREELIEAITHLVFYAGSPTASTAIGIAPACSTKRRSEYAHVIMKLWPGKRKYRKHCWPKTSQGGIVWVTGTHNGMAAPAGESRPALKRRLSPALPRWLREGLPTSASQPSRGGVGRFTPRSAVTFTI